MKKKERRKKLSYKEQKEWNEIEDKISALEERLEKIKAEIVETGNDLGRAQELYKEQQQVEEELEQAIERWTELSLLIEEMEQNK